SVVFVFSVFNFLLLGIIKRHSPFIVRDYKEVYPTEEDVFSPSVVFILYVFCFSKGVIGGSVSPYSSDS
ncbi:MAG TPA: hypothetical protein PK016_04680, partial [Candidatus Atribacteria bacterium]|nr:hypothetical protein [Candidatus Atribacteria bacterium]